MKKNTVCSSEYLTFEVFTHGVMVLNFPPIVGKWYRNHRRQVFNIHVQAKTI